MNDFVYYLNSTNNAGSDTTGSLAEAQVKSEYYDKIKIDRKLGFYITEGLEKQRYEAFILTGHAGDGKTSILVQVLKNRKLLAPLQGLDKEKEYEDFYYVKDMSEIPQDQQATVLKKALHAPSNSKSSLLISNTGPLLKGFIELAKEVREAKGEAFFDEDRINLQSKLLNQLDKNEDTNIEVEGFRFILINIARMDNVLFATHILSNILEEGLWGPCQECSFADRCPIYKNRCYVSSNFTRVSAFIENYYRYLYENDKRMTIRQMVGQLSYALTGNLSCENIQDKHLKMPFFDYNFANLFFGYIGTRTPTDATQIRGIRQIQGLGLDKIALDVDYKLFVQHNYSSFSSDIQEILRRLQQTYKWHYRQVEDDGQPSNGVQRREALLRCAIRRFYLMYSTYENESEIDAVLNQVFGSNYMDYKHLISKEQSKVTKRKTKGLIFQALCVKNTGFMPTSQTNELPLTLRREDEIFQNVMLVLGSINKESLKVEQLRVRNRFEDIEEKYHLVLKIDQIYFPITLPLFTYFDSLINGAIATNDNPALSHGIATLDALLLDSYGDDTPDCKEDCEIKVIVNTTGGQKTYRFGFINNQLGID